MPKINVLPKSVAELIAAGEVVERPRSVVKELMENSIDAGAKRITVEIKNGGNRYIRVTDDGCGIAREDVRTAFVSHATSKISGAEDLAGIFTLGFRGEALPSVSAVARLSLLTRTADEEEGTRICIEGGEETDFESAGCPTGTTIVVKDLFFNTPARMKFLKKDVTEGNYAADAVTRTALSHPEIKFTFFRDEKRVLDTPGTGDLAAAVYAVFGKETADALLPCAYSHEGIEVEGYVSRPLQNRPNRNMQYFFVNGRNVRIPAAAPALDNAYKNSIMVGKFPMCFLNIRIDVNKTDVNVHPAKTEIRFADEGKIYEAVYFAARAALSVGDVARPNVRLRTAQELLAPKRPQTEQLRIDPVASRTPAAPAAPPEGPAAAPAGPYPSGGAGVFDAVEDATPAYPHKPVPNIVFEEPPVKTAVFRDESRLAQSESPLAAAARGSATGYAPLPETKPAAPAADLPAPAETAPGVDVKPEAEVPPEVHVLGEVFRTYLIASCGDRLIIVDKHAAHERMLYNKLIAVRGKPDSQQLLAPVTVALSGREYAAVTENLDVLADAGFDVEDFGSPTVIVRSCPVRLTGEDIPLLISEIAGQLCEGNAAPEPEKLRWIYESAACKAAVKAGSDMPEAEIRMFVERILQDPALRYCPHGRPVLYELTRHELEKQFGRVT